MVISILSIGSIGKHRLPYREFWLDTTFIPVLLNGLSAAQIDTLCTKYLEYFITYIANGARNDSTWSQNFKVYTIITDIVGQSRIYDDIEQWLPKVLQKNDQEGAQKNKDEYSQHCQSLLNYLLLSLPNDKDNRIREVIGKHKHQTFGAILKVMDTRFSSNSWYLREKDTDHLKQLISFTKVNDYDTNSDANTHQRQGIMNLIKSHKIQYTNKIFEFLQHHLQPIDQYCGILFQYLNIFKMMELIKLMGHL
ncbi:hypothetical protein SAMD00019534_116690 [Acytostelium subglobosum LB1]|uniref:hypothetical protein n=1 Tax=Acytostelium subglobosum LB1 TaxID=1410327 RepID=UPI00064489F4|nr:hypothetical protein SAMD00019534_116690 [Acytostelium subglobosum LB1]GAM28493.1 hypothetical protein SAMD00019534_116690 [Acytostelium subglobosum LB1]|eukprot:XP_012748532.1 hypothetical protein SAMD00019534_116690 [Acytostelium subglobosum LB1]